MSTFDPQVFMDVSTEESHDTTLIPVPVGEYTAVTGAPSMRQATSKEGKDLIFLEVPLVIDDQSVKEATGRDKVSVRYSTMIDIENGMIATGTGKNVGLGKLREATGLNKKGEKFNFRMLEGRPLRVNVSHRMHDGETYAEAKGVAPL